MGMICIISGNHLPVSFWKTHLEETEIKRVSQEDLKHIDLSKDNPDAIIIDDYFNSIKTSMNGVRSIASRFKQTAVFHLSPENAFGIEDRSKVKFHSFSPQFLDEINQLKT